MRRVAWPELAVEHFFSLTNLFAGLAVAVGGVIGAVGLWFLARWSVRWTIALIAVLIILLSIFLSRAFPEASASLGNAPEFVRDGFWPLATLLALGVFLTIVLMIRAFRTARAAAGDEAFEDEPAARDPEIDGAWQEIAVRLSQAKVDPTDRHTYLVLSPHEDWARALVRASGVQIFAQAPEVPAPVHAFATPEILLVECAGASALGAQDGSGARRLEAVCRRLLELSPHCPVARGVVVVFPLSWAGDPDSVRWAAAVRDDLAAVERALKIRCPVYALITEMEIAPGFPEFLGRLADPMLQNRCGFAVPASHDFSGDLAQRGLVWMSRWFQGWTLHLMVDDLLDAAGNRRLFTLGHEFRRYRKRLRSILESAFSTLRSSDPVLFRGCYFAATGPGPGEQAFLAGLLRGPRAKIVADHAAARWTAEALDDDRAYRRAALVVGLVGGALTLLGWFLILRENPDRPFWWAGPVALLLGWAVSAAWMFRR